MKIRLALIALAASVLAATPAHAADYNATLNAETPSFDWAGGPGSGVAVSTPLGGLSSRFLTSDCLDGFAECEEALLKVELPATLTVSVNADDDSTDALDVYLYPSNEAGEYDESEDDLGDASGATVASDEKVTVAVQPGYYMARVEFYDANEDTYKGNALLSGFTAPPAPPAAPPPPPPPPPGEPSQPSQPAQPAPSEGESNRAGAKKRAAKKCRKKAKRIKNKKKRKKALKRCARKAR